MPVKSQVQGIKAKYRMNKIQVIEALGITEDQYNAYLFDCGIPWIETRVWNDEYITARISKSAYIWQLYTNQWNIAEDAFLMDHYLYVLHGGHQRYLLYRWAYYHEPKP